MESFSECTNNDDYEDIYDEDEDSDYSDFDCECGAWRWNIKQGKPIHIADCVCGSSEPW